MALRACAYKNCENYELNGTRSGDFSLFVFPKDLERRRQWFELGKVNKNIPPNDLYLCSQHFDSRYISKNPRRLVLLGMAKPNPYMEHDNFSDELQLKVDYNVLHTEYIDDVKEERLLEQKLKESEKNCVAEKYVIQDPLESTLIDEEEEFSGNDCITEDHLCFVPSSELPRNTGEESNRKRKINDSIHISQIKLKPKVVYASKSKKQNCTSLLRSQDSSLNQSNHNLQIEANDSNTDENDWIDASKTTVFIFKGEEYVQMSKSYYIEEKLSLLNQLTMYKNMLLKIKQNVNSLNIS